MKIEIPVGELEALHRKQHSDVLPITVHVQLDPPRLSFLGADGELKTYSAGQQPAAQGEVPPPQRISIDGIDANLFGAIGGRP
jgi:hypothetical protein